MAILKYLTFLFSIVAHGALGYAFVTDYHLNDQPPSFFEGVGEDQLQIESSIQIEGITSLGSDIETIQASDFEPQEARQAVAAVEEIETVEELREVDEIISANAEQVDETEMLHEPKPEDVIEPVKPQAVAQLEQAEQVAVEEKQAASGRQDGGDVTKRNKHFGKIGKHIRQHIINPRTRIIGTTVVRFKVDAAGQLLSREVLKSSGSKRLDDAAMATIDRAAPFPPFPEGAITQAASLKMKFNFSTR